MQVYVCTYIYKYLHVYMFHGGWWGSYLKLVAETWTLNPKP
jgi:hypothetical protein